MSQITRDNFQQVLASAGFNVSKCGVCGLPKFKAYWPGLNWMVLEIRPTQTQFGTYVIYKNNSAVSSGYLYELHKHLQTHFPAAKV